jgi:hypothetical protein
LLYKLIALRPSVGLKSTLLDILCLALYSSVAYFPLDSKAQQNISITALACLIALSVYRQVIPHISNSEMRQKQRALKKLPLLLIVLFFTISNILTIEVAYGLVGLGLLLSERNVRVAFFTWPFLLVSFFDYSAIIEWTIIFFQSVSILMLKEQNE